MFSDRGGIVLDINETSVKILHTPELMMMLLSCLPQLYDYSFAALQSFNYLFLL